MRWPSCLAGIAALAFAGPAAALTLVFHVHVTGAQGVAGFTPFSFQQAWTFGAGTATLIGGASRLGQVLQGQASAGPPPDGFDVSAHSLAHFGTLSASGAYAFETGADFAAARTFVSLDAVQQSQLVVAQNSSIRFVRYHRVSLEAAGGASFLEGAPYPATEAGLAAYIAAAGPIAWRDEAGDRVTLGSGGPTDLSRRVYIGTAVLAPSPPLTAVPEPGAWALLIGGFGLAGAALRRGRRRAASAAA